MKRCKLILFLAVYSVVFSLTSCSSENENSPEGIFLAENISKDFNNRYNSFTIESVFTGSDFYHDSELEETYITCTDTESNKCLVVYLEGIWNRTIRTFSDTRQLPYAVQERLESCLKEPAKVIDQIKEAEFAALNTKEYIIRYRQDTLQAKNCVHTLVTDDNGTILRLCTYSLNEPDNVYPLTENIGWIKQRYRGASILGYINDLGDDEFMVKHDGIMKTVRFRFNRNYDCNWESTTYPLQPDSVIPTHVLERLQAIAPNFSYTDVTVIESKSGTGYTFTDNSKADSPGYTIGSGNDL